MPGILDNLTNGGWGNYFGGFGAAMNPQIQENQFRQQAYQALAAQNGPQDAAILMGNPQAFGLGFQRQLFMDQLNDISRRNPNMSLSEALYHLSPEGQKQQYGINFGPPVEAGPVKLPTVYGQGQGPHLFNIGGAPTSSQQGPPSTQTNSGIDNLIALGAKANAANKAAEQTATAQPDLPIIQTRAQDVLGKLDRIKNNPELPNVVGGFLGIKGRAGPLGQGQSDLLSDINDANNALQGDLFTSMRTISSGGRPPSVGAMKEMRITDLTARTGTVQGYKDNIDRAKKQIQDEYEAAWKARGSPDAYKPNWGQSQPTQSAGPKQITNEQDYAQVKSGEHYMDPQGVLRVKR